VAWLLESSKLPISRACDAVGLSRSSWYRPPPDPGVRDGPVIDRLNEVISRHGRWGFWKCFRWMRQRGA
jgi:putative transposase